MTASVTASSRAECVLRRDDSLGEVPIWHGPTSTLWWVDVKAPALQSFQPASGTFRRFDLAGRTVGSWSFRNSGGMVLAMQDGLHAFDPHEGHMHRLVAIGVDDGQHRLNDGRCDRRGRFWVGSMHESLRDHPRGAFYRVGRDLACASVFDGVTVPNSVAFSPDDTRMYFADTPTRTIFAFDFDLDAGTLSNRRVFASQADFAGGPDGSTVDVEGCLWNAVYGAGQVVRYAPDGRIDRMIQLPVSQPTSCAFGGDDLRTLYVTTAAQKLSVEARAQQPLAGSLFAIDSGTQGLPEPSFAG